MEFVQKTKPRPYKIIPIPVPIEFTWLSNGDLKVIETMKREMLFKKEEAEKTIQSITERIKFNEYEIGEEYTNKIKREIEYLKEIRKSWEQAIKDKL